MVENNPQDYVAQYFEVRISYVLEQAMLLQQITNNSKILRIIWPASRNEHWKKC